MLNWRELGADERADWFETRLCRDFPADEVKPLDLLEKLCEQGRYHCYLFYEQPEVPVGYAYLMTIDRFTLLDYLAVEPSMRGGGYGSQILPILEEMLPEGNTLLIEAENPACAVSLEDRSVRLARVRFYKKAGMRLTEVLEKAFGVDFRILTGGAQVSDREIADGLSAVYAAMLPETVFRQQFSVWIP